MLQPEVELLLQQRSTAVKISFLQIPFFPVTDLFDLQIGYCAKIFQFSPQDQRFDLAISLKAYSGDQDCDRDEE
ncbi:MAG: hypothetical protein ABFE02_02200 [Sulfuricella sp.]